MRNLLKNLLQDGSGRSDFNPGSINQNNFKRILVIHLVTSLIVVPVYAYLIRYTGLPNLYYYLAFSYLLMLPIYAFICWVSVVYRDRLIYFLIAHYFVITSISFYSLNQNNFDNNQLFFFLGIYALGIIFIQRWYSSVIYNLFVLLLLVYGLVKTGETTIPKPLIILLFIIISCTGLIVVYTRKKVMSRMEEYSNYLHQLMNHPGAGFLLFKFNQDELKIYDSNDQVFITLHIHEKQDELLTEWLNKNLTKSQLTQLKNLQKLGRFTTVISGLHHGIKYHTELSIRVVVIKGEKFLLARVADITEQIQKREELELSEKRYKNLYSKNKAGVFTIDKNSIIIKGNSSFFEMFENTLKTGDRLFPFDSSEDWEMIVESFGENENSKNYQTRLKLKNNKEKSFIFSWYYDTQTKFIEGSVIDLTTIQQASEALMQSEEKYRLIYEESNDAILLLDNDKIINVNRRAIQLFGLPEEELLQTKLFDLSANTDHESKKEYKGFVSKLGNSRSAKFNWLFNRKLGASVIEAEVTLIEIMLEKRLFYQCVIHDNTELNKNLKAIQSNQRNLEYILDNNPEGIVILRGNEVLYRNSEFDRIVGERAGLQDLFTKSDQEKFNKLLKEQASTKKRKSIELKLKSKEKESILVDITMVSTLFEEEEATLMIIKDVSVQKRLAKEKIRAELAEESNKNLEKEIKVRIKTEKLLEDQYLRTKAILDSSSNTFLLTLSLDNKITSYNTHCEAYFYRNINKKIKVGGLINKYFEDHFNPVVFRLFKIYLEGAKKGQSRQLEVEFYNKEKSFWMEVFLNPIIDNNGKVSEISLVAHDISEKKKTSIEIEESLKEKEILLKEIHHRVKNNLQVISSILNLQSSFVHDENTLEILQESRNRIRSMAIIHENLYRTEDFSSINFSQYLTNLSQNLISSYRIEKNVVLNTNMEDVDLVLDQAIPCGLLVNELITNALKYAWEEGEEGVMNIQLYQKKSTVHLEISDNGKGLPVEFTEMESDTLGLQLVITLVEQLDGEITVDIEKGTKYLIKFDNIKPPTNVKD